MQNRIIAFAEGYHYTLDELKRTIPEGFWNSVFDELKNRRFLKTVRASYKENDLEIEPEEKDLRYQFVFVGLLVIGDFVAFIYPKYYLDSDENGSLKLHPDTDSFTNEEMESGFSGKGHRTECLTILRVIDNVRGKVYSEDLKSSLYSDKESRLSLMLFFLQDYFNHGLYTNKKKIIEVNGVGEVDWCNTIDRVDPIFRRKTPFYIDVYTGRSIQHDEGILSRLHAAILSECSDSLALTGILEFLGITSVDDVLGESIESLGSDKYLKRQIDVELNSVFDTRKRLLLGKMKAYLDEESRLGTGKDPLYWGTCNFNLVWEKVIKDVFEHHGEKTLLELGIDERSVMLTGLILKPQYRIEGKEIGVDTLIPDCLHVEKSFGEKKLYILDAKYYRYRRTSCDQLYGAPGVGDINKQHLYELAFSKDFDSIYNCFLFPGTDSDTHDKPLLRNGTVHMPILRSIQFKDRNPLGEIALVYVNADLIFRAFLAGAAWKCSALEIAE